jgi:hypothetical protein
MNAQSLSLDTCVWMGHAVPRSVARYDLRQDYSVDNLQVIWGYGINLPRLSTFIQRTRELGGLVSKLTLSLANFIILFQEDSDATFVILSVAYGVDMDYAPPEDTEFFKVENYVSDEHAPKVTAQIRKELREGRIVPITRDRIIGISAIGAVRKGEDGIRIINDYSRPAGRSVNSGITTRKETFAKVTDAAAQLRPKALHCKADIT